MAVLLFSTLSQANEKSAYASTISVERLHAFPIYSYPNPQIWEPSPFKNGHPSVYPSEVKSPEQKNFPQTNAEKFHDTLIEIAFNSEDRVIFNNTSPQPHLMDSPFCLTSFSWPSLPLQSQDCQILEAIALLQKVKELTAPSTFFTMTPEDYLRQGNFSN
jgi:hypothetical protein